MTNLSNQSATATTNSDDLYYISDSSASQDGKIQRDNIFGQDLTSTSNFVCSNVTVSTDFNYSPITVYTDETSLFLGAVTALTNQFSKAIKINNIIFFGCSATWPLTSSPPFSFPDIGYIEFSSNILPSVFTDSAQVYGNAIINQNETTIPITGTTQVTNPYLQSDTGTRRVYLKTRSAIASNGRSCWKVTGVIKL